MNSQDDCSLVAHMTMLVLDAALYVDGRLVKLLHVGTAAAWGQCLGASRMQDWRLRVKLCAGVRRLFNRLRYLRSGRRRRRRLVDVCLARRRQNERTIVAGLWTARAQRLASLVPCRMVVPLCLPPHAVIVDDWPTVPRVLLPVNWRLLERLRKTTAVSTCYMCYRCTDLQFKYRFFVFCRFVSCSLWRASRVNLAYESSRTSQCHYVNRLLYSPASF